MSACTGVTSHRGRSSAPEAEGRDAVAAGEQYDWWVGIDWATQAHQVWVLDGKGRQVAERSVKHAGSAIGDFGDWLVQVTGGQPARVGVAIEIPRGAVVETLVERGFHVYALNPKQLDRFRDRYTVAGAKDDRRDAFVLAASLRTDPGAFRRVRLDEPLIIELREYSRMDEDLRDELARLANRRREQLPRVFPQLLELVPAADEPWLWALLEAVPIPRGAARVRRPQIDKVLRAHRIRRIDAAQVQAALARPPLPVAPGTVEAASAHVALLVPRLRLGHEQRQRCGRQIEALLARLGQTGTPAGPSGPPRDVRIVRSVIGVGRRVSATLFAEAAPLLGARDYPALRAHAGIAPVTRQRGTRTPVVMRYACNGRLREAVYHWARVSVQHDARSTGLSADARRRGHTHGRALRGVADRLLRMLVAMLKSHTVYDPQFARRPAGVVPPHVTSAAEVAP